MNRAIWIFCVVGLVACTSRQNHAWRESGSSWGESGKQTMRALGESDPDATNRKEEWKQVGRDFGQAGTDTGRAISKSITPESSGSEEQTPPQ